MKDLIAYADARLGESGTWASIAAALVALHLQIDPGLWSQIVNWGIGLSVALGVVMKEADTKPGTTVAADALAAAASSIGSKPTALGLALTFGLAVSLAACGQPAQTGVSEAEVALTAAEAAAFQYAKLPACPTAALCSSPATVATIKQLDDVAYAAVKVAMASGSSNDTTAAMTAIAALSAAIPTR